MSQYVELLRYMGGIELDVTMLDFRFYISKDLRTLDKREYLMIIRDNFS